MATLWRYVGTRFLRAFLGSLLVLALVVLVVEMLLDLGEILEAEDDFVGVLKFLGLRFSSFYLPYLIPVASFTGALLSVGLAARSHEIMAIKAGGISPLWALLPVFLAAGLLSLVALTLNETVSRQASATLQDRDRGDAGDLSLRSGKIWYHTGRFIYNIRDPDSENETVSDIRVYERNEAGRLVRFIQAASAQRLAPNLWSFREALVRDFDLEAPDSAPAVRRAPEITLELAEDRSPRLLEAEIDSLPLLTLARYLRTGPDNRRAQATLHQRLSSPLLVLLFTLVAVPLGLRVEQTGSLALPALEGILVLFLFLSAREYGATFAVQGLLPAALVPWVTLAVFGSYGTWRLLQVDR